MAIHLINSYRFTPVGIALAVASGGIAIGGSADASISNIQNGVAQGNIGVGGSATATLLLEEKEQATAGIVISGSAVPTLGVEEEEQATATVVITGAATASTSFSAPANATGNVVIGGESTASTSFSAPASATGNIVIGGSSSAPSINISATGSATGNIAISGSAASSISTSAPASATGNIAIGGSATSSTSITQIASATGDISITGSATPSTSVSVSASATGNVAVGGSATASTSIAQTVSATGNIAIGGSATASVGITQTASAAGNIVIGGSSATPSSTCWPLNFPVSFPMPCGAPVTHSATGNIVIGGSATASTTTNTIVNPSATGNVVIGGSATAGTSLGASGVATGNIVIGGSASGVTSMGSSTTNGIATGNIVIGGNATATTVTPYSNVYSVTLNGSSDYLPIAGSQSSGNFDFLIDDMNYTVAMWFSLDDYTQSDSQVLLANNYTGSFNGIQIWYDNRSGISTNAIRVNSWAGSSVSTQTNNAITDTNWHHLVVTASGANGTLSVYLDGNTTPIATASLGSVTSSSTQQDLAIGGRIISNAVNSSLDGRIDEVSIWNTAISSADVSSLYNGGSPVDLLDSSSYDTDRTGDLFSWWRMGDGTEAASGSTVYDMSSNSNNATLNGTFTTGVPTASPPVATGNIVVSGSATATLGTGASGTATGNIVIGGSATGTAAQPSNESLVAAMSGKEIWLDASVFDGSDASNNPSDTTEVGDGTYDWSDRTGNYTLTQYSPTSTDQPYYRSSLPAFNNKGAVHFPRGNRPLYISSGRTSGYKHLFVVHNAPYSNEAGTFNNNGTYMTPFGHYGEHRNANQDKLLIRGASGSTAARHLYTYDSTWGEHYFENNAAFKDGVQVLDSQTTTYVASSRTPSDEPFSTKSINQKYTYSSSFVDGSAPIIWEFKFTASTDQALRYLNRGEVNGVGFIYHIGEFLAFTDHLSDADRLTVYKYLADKYDIPVYTGENTVVQESNLQHWFKFEEGSAGQGGRYIRDWADSTKANYIRNGATLQSGRRGNCVRFADGVNDELSWTSHTYNLQSNYTFAFWAKRDSSNGGSVATIYSGSSGIEVQVGGSNTVFKHDSTSVTSTTVPAQGDWAHYALTYDGTTMTAYIDGTSVGTASLSSPSSGSMYIRAGRGISTANPFVGDMDDLRLYSVALTSSEVASVAADDSLNHYYNI